MSADEGEFGDIFQEPDGFRPPSPPARTQVSWIVPGPLRRWIKDSPVPPPVAQHLAVGQDARARAPENEKEGPAESGKSLPAASACVPLELVGFSPLWGHHLWNASAIVSEYLLTYARELLSTPTGAACVLELGAASGLPSIVAARYGPYASAAETASGYSVATINPPHVVATDYPDPDLIACLKDNLKMNGVGVPQAATPQAKSMGTADAQVGTSFFFSLSCFLTVCEAHAPSVLRDIYGEPTLRLCWTPFLI